MNAYDWLFTHTTEHDSSMEPALAEPGYMYRLRAKMGAKEVNRACTGATPHEAWNRVTEAVAREFGWKPVDTIYTVRVLNTAITSNPDQWEHTHHRLQDVLACIAEPWEPVRVTEEFVDHVPTGRLFPSRINDEIKFALLMARHKGCACPFEITVEKL